MQIIPENLLEVAGSAGHPAAFKKFFYKNVLDTRRDFYWTEKTDGLHMVLVVYEGCLYQVIEKKCVLIDSHFPSADILVLDTELYAGKYYVFDCYYLNASLTGEKLNARLAAAAAWLQKNHICDFVLKSFRKIHGIKDLEEAFSYVFMESSPATGCKIDGVILQEDAPVAAALQYKWKKERRITSDFLLRYNENEKSYTLFVVCEPEHCKPVKEISFSEMLKVCEPEHCKPVKEISFSEMLKIGGTVLCPVSIPLQEGIHIFMPRPDWSRNGYTPDEISRIEELMDKALHAPSFLTGEIVEMSPAEDGWVPFRIRGDKTVPDTYNTAFNDILSCFEYPAFFEKEMYFENRENTTQTDLVHRISRRMRRCQFDRLAMFLPKGCTDVLDIACGRGGDYEILVDMGLSNIFGIDNVFNCAKYAIRVNGDCRPCRVNLIPGYLSGHNEKILQDIKSRAEFPTEGFPVFVIDYAIHYLLENPGGMEELRKFVSCLAAPDAVLFFTAFDGEAMEKDADENGILDFGSFRVTVDKINHTAMMTLPTIKGDAQREKIFMDQDLKDLGLTLLDSFYPLAGNEESFRTENADPGILRYYGYMKAFIVKV